MCFLNLYVVVLVCQIKFKKYGVLLKIREFSIFKDSVTKIHLAEKYY